MRAPEALAETLLVALFGSSDTVPPLRGWRGATGYRGACSAQCAIQPCCYLGRFEIVARFAIGAQLGRDRRVPLRIRRKVRANLVRTLFAIWSLC
jgi:hypothetical protein